MHYLECVKCKVYPKMHTRPMMQTWYRWVHDEKITITPTLQGLFGCPLNLVGAEGLEPPTPSV